MSRKFSKLSLLVSSVITANANALNYTDKLKFKDLSRLGISKDSVQSAFRNSQGITINMDEILKVSVDDEGKNYKFDTLDNISVIIPIESSLAAPNKTEPDVEI